MASKQIIIIVDLLPRSLLAPLIMQGASEGLVCPYIAMFVELNGAMTSEGVIFLWNLNVANNQITIIVNIIEMLC